MASDEGLLPVDGQTRRVLQEWRVLQRAAANINLLLGAYLRRRLGLQKRCPIQSRPSATDGFAHRFRCDGEDSATLPGRIPPRSDQRAETPRRNVELCDRSGRALSPLAQSNAPCCPDVEEFLKTILNTFSSCSIYDPRTVTAPY